LTESAHDNPAEAQVVFCDRVADAVACLTNGHDIGWGYGLLN
jgi:hypothetical protein